MPQLHPALRAFRVRGAVRRPQLPKLRRQRVELRPADSSAQLDIVGILHAADAVGDDETAQPLGIGQREVECDKPAGGAPTRWIRSTRRRSRSGADPPRLVPG